MPAKELPLLVKRWQHMVSRLFLVYAVVELAVAVALVSTIGFGWTLLLLLVTFVAGVARAGSQGKRELMRLRSGLATSLGGGTTRLWEPAADSALVALATVLVVVPGLVTTVAGLLLLLPPTRAAARPVLAALAMRKMERRAALITVTTVGGDRYASARPPRGDFIDGEVIDVNDFEPPALPRPE